MNNRSTLCAPFERSAAVNRLISYSPGSGTVGSSVSSGGDWGVASMVSTPCLSRYVPRRCLGKSGGGGSLATFGGSGAPWANVFSGLSATRRARPSQSIPGRRLGLERFNIHFRYRSRTPAKARENAISATDYALGLDI